MLLCCFHASFALPSALPRLLTLESSRPSARCPWSVLALHPCRPLIQPSTAVEQVNRMKAKGGSDSDASTSASGALPRPMYSACGWATCGIARGLSLRLRISCSAAKCSSLPSRPLTSLSPPINVHVQMTRGRAATRGRCVAARRLQGRKQGAAWAARSRLPRWRCWKVGALA